MAWLQLVLDVVGNKDFLSAYLLVLAVWFGWEGYQGVWRGRTKAVTLWREREVLDQEAEGAGRVWLSVAGGALVLTLLARLL